MSLKKGTGLIVTAMALVSAGVPGFVDGPITIVADNGATVNATSDTTAEVTLVNDGDTTITATAVADGVSISGGPLVETAAEPATFISLTATVKPA